MRSYVSKRGGQGKVFQALRTTYAKALLAVGMILYQFSQSLFYSFALISAWKHTRFDQIKYPVKAHP